VLIRDAAKDRRSSRRAFSIFGGDRLFAAGGSWGNTHTQPLPDVAELHRRKGHEHRVLRDGAGEAPHNAMIWRLLSDGFKGRTSSIVCARYAADLGYLEDRTASSSAAIRNYRSSRLRRGSPAWRRCTFRTSSRTDR